MLLLLKYRELKFSEFQIFGRRKNDVTVLIEMNCSQNILGFMYV